MHKLQNLIKLKKKLTEKKSTFFLTYPPHQPSPSKYPKYLGVFVSNLHHVINKMQKL